MKKTIYVFSDGEIKRRQNTIYFESDKGRKYVPVENTGEILIFGEVTLNKRILEFFTQQEIILHFFNRYGYYVGSFYPREHLNSGYMILKQAEHYLDKEKRLLLARLFVWGALENIKKVLAYYINRGVNVEDIRDKIENLQNQLGDVQSVEEAMALEGNARDYYYRGFDKILDNRDFIICGYAFILALILGPLVGYRGLTTKGPLSAKLVYAGNTIGALTSLLGIIVLLYAAWMTL